MGLERTALHRCFLSKASFASGKKSCGRAGASWDLISWAPCTRPGFTLPGRTKQTQRQHCSSERGLGRHCMHTTISRCRQHLAFCSGPQADSGTRRVPSPQERRGDRNPAHRPRTGMGSCGDCTHFLPGHPVPSRTLPPPGGRRKLAASSLSELFLRVQGRRQVASPCLHQRQVANAAVSWA